jgi:hypothetical protein
LNYYLNNPYYYNFKCFSVTKSSKCSLCGSAEINTNANVKKSIPGNQGLGTENRDVKYNTKEGTTIPTPQELLLQTRDNAKIKAKFLQWL